MKLLEPIQVGKLTFKNRLMFPPMTTGYEEDGGVIGERSYSFYKRVAEGGAGYIVLGNVVPTVSARSSPTIHCEENLPSYHRLAEACHAAGAKLGVQLYFREYDVEKFVALFEAGKADEARQVIVDGMAHFTDTAAPAHLHHLIDCMVNSAKLAVQAGIDVIEIHGDRLTGALCSTKLNHRTDEYGGSFENRTRFAIEQVRAVRAALPDVVLDYKLAIRAMTPDGLRGNGGLELDEAIRFAKMLEEAGCDMIHPAQANHTSNIADTIPPMGIQPYGTVMKEAYAIKQAVRIPTACVARIVTPQAAETILEEGKADIVALGRPLLADPYFGQKCAAGRFDEIRTCMMCNKGCADGIMNATFASCVLNPENGHEAERAITPAAQPKKIAVVGAGIAGLEAARVAALKGHKVELFEKDLRVGGQINLAAIPPRKEEMLRSVRYYEAVLPKLGVVFRLGKEATAADLAGFDAVIAATGATNIIVPVPGHDLVSVVSAWDVLDHKAIVFGRIAVIGGGLVGAETAEYLGKLGFDVTVVEMLDEVAKAESKTIRPYMMENYAKYGIKQQVNTTLQRIEPGRIFCSEKVTENGAETAREVVIPVDFVVMAVGARQYKPDLSALKVPVLWVGDCGGERASDISHATRSAYDAANSL